MNFNATKCGPRRSKANPDAYDLQQVRAFAISLGIPVGTKAKMCALIKARLVGPQPAAAAAAAPPAARAGGLRRFKPELCGPRRSKANPNAYDLSQTKAFANAKGIHGKTKADLCRKLTEQRAAMIAKARQNLRARRVNKMRKAARAVGVARGRRLPVLPPPVIVPPGPPPGFDSVLCGPVRSRTNPHA